jgi:hypothetical protein
MAIPIAIFLGPQNVAHPVRADQTLGEHFRSRCCVPGDSASPIATYHHRRRHSRNPSATVPHLLKSGSALLRNIQLP